jgi:hypothetical protein
VSATKAFSRRNADVIAVTETPAQATPGSLPGDAVKLGEVPWRRQRDRARCRSGEPGELVVSLCFAATHHE